VKYAKRTRARDGITLIEILVSLAIITVLVSLSAAAIFKIKVNGMVRSTETSVARIQVGVDTQVKIIADNVRTKDRQQHSPDFTNLVAYCGGDEDRAAALLMYCRLKQNFPNPNELSSTMAFGPQAGRPGFTAFGVNFAYSPAFAKLAAATGSPEAVSAAVLRVALSEKAQGGNSFNAAEGTAGDIDLTLGPVTAPAFKDAWDMPIAFKRFHEAPDLSGNSNQDPFDPTGKLANWLSPSSPNPPHPKTVAENALGPAFSGVFDGKNKAIVVYAAGVNKNFEGLGGDDIVGYRLRSVGERGGK